MIKRTTALFAAVLPLCAWTGRSAEPSVWDDFDGYAVGQTFISPTNGWQASSNTVVITNSAFQSAPKSVMIPRRSALTNTVNGGTGKVVWTDCYVKPVLGELPSDLPTNEASVVVSFNASGHVQVASASGWVTCSNDVWGNAIAPATSGFARVSIYQNYSASNAVVMIDGRVLIQDLRFVGTSDAYNSLTVVNPSSNAFLDNVWIKTNYDSATLTNDFNANGMADAGELALYGYVARNLYVGSGSGYPHFNDFAGALTNWRSRDVIYVHAGSYAEDLVLSNSVTFGGSAFTNTGTLTVKSGASPVFQNGTMWGAVAVESNAAATFAGGVTCAGAFTVGSGATVNLGQGGTLGSLDAAGTVVVGAGKTLTVSGAATVSGGVQLSGSGSMVVNGTLSVSGSGVLTFTNSLLNVASGNVVLNGTFTVNNTWGQSAAVLPLPFVDDFERYWEGAKISELGFAGWGATATNAEVQSAVANTAFGGSKGLLVPANSVVSNRITTSAKKIWTDCYVMPHLGKSPFNPPTNTAGFVSFVDTNGWLEVATSNGWDICSNLVSGGQPDRMTTSSWTRVTVCQNLTNNTVAVFINGKLVRQLMKAPGSPMVTYSSLEVGNVDGQSYLDDVAITEVLPGTITTDLDRDLVLDVYEVDRLGSVTARNDWVGGAVYLIR